MARTHSPATRAADAKAWLDHQGFTPEVLENMGAFVALWAIFESRVEHVIWSFEGAPSPNTRPSTDAQGFGKWLERLKALAASQEPAAQSVLLDLVAAARDLAAYRNAMLHGWLIPAGAGGPMFLSNPRWGNLQRRRGSEDAHVHADMAQLAIATAVDLLQVAAAFIARGSGADLRDGAREEARRARTAASEVRHIADMMSSEQY